MTSGKILYGIALLNLAGRSHGTLAWIITLGIGADSESNL